jgi:hypothetical protein
MAPIAPDDDLGEARITDALRELRTGYGAVGPAHGLEDRILTLVAVTPQRHRRPFGLRRWPGSWPADARFAIGAVIGAAGLAAALVVASLGTGIFAAHVQPTPSASGTPLAPSAAATDARAVNAPHVPGTCPVTPITRIAGGAAPEVDVSGLRWRWGGRPWVAYAPEKVVWLTDANDVPVVSVFGTQLGPPIVPAGQTQPDPTDKVHAVDTLASNVSVDDVVVRGSGCWLLTAIWAGGASSVVVAVAPPASQPNPNGGVVFGGPLGACPASSPSTAPAPQGWPGPAYDDGPFRWLLPPTATWKIGGTGDKLVAGPADWAAEDGEVVALPVGLGRWVGETYGSSAIGDLPTVGSGTLGFGLTLPNRDCWAIVYLDAAGTSTVVTDLSQTSGVPGGSPAPARLLVALDVKPVPEPSGITCTCPDFSTYLGQLFTAGGKEVATWNLRQPSGLLHSLAPGSYSLVVSQVFVTDNAETGVRSSGAPTVQCTTDLTLAPNTSTKLTATFDLAPRACAFDTPLVTGP